MKPSPGGKRRSVSAFTCCQDDNVEKVAKKYRLTVPSDKERSIGMDIDNDKIISTAADRTAGQVIYHDDGLFVHIASFCDLTTNVRLCTATKANCEGRSRLTGRLLYCASAPRSPATCVPILSQKELLLLGSAHACRGKKCVHEENNLHDSAPKLDCKGLSSTGEPSAGDEFLDGQELIKALMMRVTFDLRWIPTPMVIPPM